MNRALEAFDDIVHIANDYPEEKIGKEAKHLLLWLMEAQQEDSFVKICERNGCGKFLVPKRSGRKKFCSNYCRVTGSRDPKKWAAYMRAYRNSPTAEDNSTFIELLQKARSLGLSNQGIADKVSVSQSTISNWMWGKGLPSPTIRKRVRKGIESLLPTLETETDKNEKEISRNSGEKEEPSLKIANSVMKSILNGWKPLPWKRKNAS